MPLHVTHLHLCHHIGHITALWRGAARTLQQGRPPWSGG